jgi:hypothetical protein
MKVKSLAKAFRTAFISRILFGVFFVFTFDTVAIKRISFFGSIYEDAPLLGLKGLLTPLTKTLPSLFMTLDLTNTRNLIVTLLAYFTVLLFFVIFLTQLILFIKRKKPVLLLNILYELVFFVTIIYYAAALAYILGYDNGSFPVSANGYGYALTLFLPFKYTTFPSGDEWNVFLSVTAYLSVIAFLVFAISTLVLAFGLFTRAPKLSKKVTLGAPIVSTESKEGAKPSKGVVQGAAIADAKTDTYVKEGAEEGGVKTRAVFGPDGVFSGAPLIVQYFNNGVAQAPAPVQQAPQPVVAPVTLKAEEENKISLDDIKKVVQEVVAAKEEKPVEPTPYEAITVDELKKIIKDEIEAASALRAKEEADKVRDHASKAESVTSTAQFKAEETKVFQTATAKKSGDVDVKVATPIVVAIPKEIKDTDSPKKAEAEPSISEDELRWLVRDNLKEALGQLADLKKTTKIEYVYEDEVVEEEEKPAKVEENIEVVADKAPEVAPVKALDTTTTKPVKKTPVVEVKAKEERGKEETIAKGEVVQLTFPERILASDKEVKTAYKEIKNLLLSYGLNSRVATSGDTFRLHKVSFAKVTVSGTSLKLYLALDPKKYVNSAIPVSDAGAKGAYKDIPLVFRVRSDLSLRRARDLIIDCMNTHGLTTLADYKYYDVVKELSLAQKAK